MSLHRRNAKRDANEVQIVIALQLAGWSVDRISAEGVPDLLISHRVYGVRLAECKSRKGRLTAAQKAWRSRWKGPAPAILRSIEDVERFMEHIHTERGASCECVDWIDTHGPLGEV